MAQRISNIYRLVTLPAFYEGFHAILGAEYSRKRFAKDILKAAPGMKVLDVGCGPATIFPYLPDVAYTGLDLNPRHIEHAKSLYGDRGRFLVGDATRDLKGENNSFDLIIVSALLHHLRDEESRELLSGLCTMAKDGGRIITFDNVWLPKQNLIAWSLNKLDSGLNIRDVSGYQRLVDGLPVHVQCSVYRDFLRIPYDHFCMTLTKRTPGEH